MASQMFPDMTGGGMPGQGAPELPPDDGKMIDLSSKLEKTACYARNESAAYPMTNLFIGDSRLGCKSDADEQLILHFEFSEFVKVHSIKLTEFNRGMDPELHPAKIHLYVNRENLGFEDCDDVTPTHTLDLTAADLKESADPIVLRYVKFQRVKSLTLFVDGNAGGDVTALGGIKLIGRTVATTNMNDFKKQG